VFRALALGARAVYIGRAYQYGLGALGAAGVTRCLELIRKELDHTMAFCGVSRVEDIGRAQIYGAWPPPGRPAPPDAQTEQREELPCPTC
jgi:L-lactate dehydrogenase (cytochrome)